MKVKDKAKSMISILIPYYNDERFLKDSIESVLAQTYTDFELILINHACSDGSREIAHSFDDERIIHVDLPANAGAGGGVILDAFLKVAHGKYIKLFCADDLLHADYLEKCLNYLSKNQNVDFCFTDEDYIDEDGKILMSSYYEERSKNIVDSGDWNFYALADYYHAVSNLPFSSCFIRRGCFDEIKIDYTIVMLFDMSLFLQFLLNNKKIGFMRERLVSYRIHEGQISSSVNEKKCIAMSFFEQIFFFKIFFETKNRNALQRLLNRQDLSSLESLKMELARYWLSLPVITFQIAAYDYLHNFFQSENHRVDERFTIAQFRNLYKHSDLAYKCLLLQSPVVFFENIGIKGTFKILIQKCLRKVHPSRTKKLTHL